MIKTNAVKHTRLQRPLRIAICEDDQKDRDHLICLLSECDPLCQIETFDRGKTFLDEYTPGRFDLLFMDIYLGDMPGTDAVLAIRKRDKAVTIAFCTISADHALDGYRLGALKYLEKPANKKLVQETLDLASMRRDSEQTIMVPSCGKTVEVALNDILFFEMRGHSVAVQLENETILTSQSMRLCDIEEMLPKPQFLRCHRGYIVNLTRVQGFDGSDFLTDDGRRVYVRLKDKNKIRAQYYDYLLSLNKDDVN